MAQANAFRWLFPLLATGLLGWWWLQSRAPGEPAESLAPSPVEIAPARAMRASSPVGEGRNRVVPGGFDLPELASATPAELRSMRDAEVARSATAPAPPASYIGADGKEHAFAYDETPEARALEQAQSDRRSLLMAQLKADPDGFARRHELTAKEAKWILDGETDFPERLLN